MSKLSPVNLGILIAIIAAISFGFYPAASRAVYADGGSISLVLLVTTWGRASLLALFCLFMRKPLFATRSNVRESAVGGFFQAISMFGIISALAYLPGPLVIIIVFTHTLMLLFFMAWRGEIKLDRATVVVTIVALIGLNFVLDPWHTQSNGSLIGMALAFAAALATVSRLYVYGHQTQARYPAVVGAENFLMAAPLISLSLFWIPLHGPASGMGYVWLAIASLSLTIGTFCLFFGISLLGSFRWSLFAKLEPVFTALFSILLMGEILKPMQYVGMVIVISSLALYQIAEQRRIKPQ